MSSVMVFAPAPQLTVTIEAHHDRADLHVHAGGQGVWQTRMISTLGAEVTLVAAVGGEVGRALEPLLTGDRISVRTIPRDSGSGWYVHDRRDGRRSEIAEEAGAPLTRHELDELYTLALAEGLRAGVAVLSGPAHPSVISPDVYRRLAADLGANGCKVIADLSGDHLRAVLDAGLHLVKVSHEELLDDGRAVSASEDDLVKALHTLRADGAEHALVSMAGAGALALLEDQAYRVRMPEMSPAEPRGAGDSMTAGVTATLATGGDLRTAVCTGAAAGALNVTRHGLGTGHVDAVRVLTGHVTLEGIS